MLNQHVKTMHLVVDSWRLYQDSEGWKLQGKDPVWDSCEGEMMDEEDS